MTVTACQAISHSSMAWLYQLPLTPIRNGKWAATTRLQFSQLEHRFGERDPGQEREVKAPHVMRHETERLEEGHAKEARQSTIKQYILLFTCQRPADTKTKQQQRRCPVSILEGAATGQRKLGSQSQSRTNHRTCQPQLSPLRQDSQVKPAHLSLNVKGRSLDRCASKCWEDNTSNQELTRKPFQLKNFACHILQNFRDVLFNFSTRVSLPNHCLLPQVIKLCKTKDLRSFPLSHPFI